MSSANVRFFAYGRFADNLILGAQAIEKTFEVSSFYLLLLINLLKINYKNEAANLIKKLKMLNLAPDERQKCNTQNGAWFCRADSNGIVFMGKNSTVIVSLIQFFSSL